MNQGRRMPPKLASKIKKVNLILPDELARQIDDWRGREEGVPNASEAIRRLIVAGLKAMTGDKKPKKARQ